MSSFASNLFRKVLLLFLVLLMIYDAVHELKSYSDMY